MSRRTDIRAAKPDLSTRYVPVPVPDELAAAGKDAGFSVLVNLLSPFLRPYRTRGAGALVALIVAAVTVLSIGSGLRSVIDHGLAAGSERQLDESLLALLAAVVVLAGATYSRFYLVSWLGERVTADLRSLLYAQLLRLTPGFFETARTGDLLARITGDTNTVQTIISSSLSQALRNGLLLAGGLIMLMVTSPRLTAMVICLAFVVVLPVVLLARKTRMLARAAADRVGDVGAHIEETLYGIRTVQSFSNEPLAIAAFTRENNAAFEAAQARIKVRAGLTATIILLAFTAVGIVLWRGGVNVLQGRMSAGDLSAFVFYAIVVSGALGAVSEVMGDIQRACAAAARIQDLLSLTPQIMDKAAPVPLPAPPRGEITLDHVRFHYPSRPDHYALDDISLKIAPGERVAVVGPSGAGKSTLFQLLLRFDDPSGGRIDFDGVDLRDAALADLRSRIGIVPQDPVIFSGTVSDNIRYGAPDASRADVERAAEAAHALEFIRTMPLQLDQPLGEKGVRLSGGQRQRLALARAIIRNPVLLLLDEATASLDSESESQVQQALETIMKGRTTIVIAHRLATVTGADRIVVLEAGRIAAIGTHAQLLRESPLYARLAALQFVARAAA